MIFDLAMDFSHALAAMPQDHPRRCILALLEEALRRDIHFIARHPTTLFQCMWNTCWWYDCPEAAKHYDPPDGGWPPEGPPWDSPWATIVPWSEYKGDRAAAVWLPNRAIAFLWRAFESKDPPARIDAATADGKVKPPDAKKRRMVVEAGATIVLEAIVSEGTDVRKVRFYAGGRVTLDNRQPLAERTLSLDLRREEPEVWPGVDMVRALFLTREYLFDVYQLTSKTPRLYQWHVHALGQAQVDAAWKPTTELVDKLYDLSNRQVAKRLEDPIEHDRYQLGDVHRLDAGDQPWSFTAIQTCALEDPAQSVLGRAWYDRKIGVRISMLGAKETRVFEGKSPESRRAPGKEGNKGDHSNLPNEVGGVTLMVERRAPATVFVALHEPFKDGQPRVETFRCVQQTDDGVAVAVVGKPGTGIDDRLLLRFWEKHDQPLTLGGDGESFTFADHVYLRIGADKVEASGDLRTMRLKVAGRPRLVVNSKDRPTTVEGGILVFDGKP